MQVKSISPIQTRFKGYNFRSRLEARYGVFFDALGINWVYETEGYELENKEDKYLPDFYLPDSKVWVEIKPLFEYNPCARKTIYMAGKISKNGWRNTIVNGLCNYPTPRTGETIQIEDCYLDYIGPYFYACDHGCSHGIKTHGVGGGCVGIEEVANSMGMRLKSKNKIILEDDYRKFVTDRCFESIKLAETVFVWIDDTTCYATLMESGYAHALGKDIRVGISNSLKNQLGVDDNNDIFESVGKHEMWFLTEMANEFVFSNSAKEAFMNLYSGLIYPDHILKIKCVSRAKNEKYMVAYGDPVERTTFGNANFYDICPDDKKFMDAAYKARSARFEHGECGAT